MLAVSYDFVLKRRTRDRMSGDNLVQLPDFAARVADGRNKSGAPFVVQEFFGDIEVAFKLGFERFTGGARITIDRRLDAAQKGIGESADGRDYDNRARIDRQFDDGHDVANGGRVFD